MFEVDEGKVQLVHKNERLEKHGDEDVLACDLNFVWETDNGCLAMFAPDLRSALYKKSDGSQPDLPGTSGPEHMTALRFPGLAPLKWSLGELIGGELTFHHGTTAKSHIKIDITKLCKYRLECKEGGTVVVGFQVQCRPSEQQSGKLSKFLTDKHCVVSVIPPNAPEDLASGE